MIAKRLAMSCVIASVAMTEAAPVMADGGDVLLGGIIGAVIGGAIVNQNNKKRQAAAARAATPAMSSYTREENRAVQVALNYFGFPVGTPDGSLGPRSREAISEYQATLGYTPTGQLTDYEHSLLITSYQRGIAGGALTQQQAAANPMGMRGLLVAWRDEAYAPTQPGPTPPAPAATTAAATAAAPATGALPNFLGAGAGEASLASACNKINLTTSTSGGFVTVSTMTDPKQALGEQFCLARGFAIAQGEELAAQVQGVTPQQIADQCAGLGPAMQPQIAELSLKPEAEVLADIQKFALSTGTAPEQLAATAKICLSVGYRTDNMPVAVASGLLLTGLGETGYGELLGHHLALGFGATARPDLALAWYDTGLAGTVPVVPGQPARGDLIHKAAYAMAGKADQAVSEPATAVLPTFQPPAAVLPAAPATTTVTP